MTRFQLEEYLSFFPTFVRLVRANHRSPAAQRIQFGPHPQQFLMLCEPPSGVARRPNAIVFAHGGGWRMGNPFLFRFCGAFLAGLGFPTLMVGYRLAPAVKFPAQWDDLYQGCQAGIRALEQSGIVPEKWILGGQSAGAQLAALVAFADPARRDALFGQLAGLFLISGPLDFSLCTTGDADKLIADYTGSEKNREIANPIQYVKGDEDFPVLCIHGDRDPTVDPRNSLAFAEKVGPKAQLCVAKGWHHSDLVEIFIKLTIPATKTLTTWLAKV